MSAPAFVQLNQFGTWVQSVHPPVTAPVASKRPTHPVVARVRPVRRIDHEDDQVERAVAVHVGDRDPSAFVLPREPSRYRHPGRPPADCDLVVSAVAHPVVGSVGATGGLVHRQHDKVRTAVPVDVGDRDASTGVLRAEPIRDRSEISVQDQANRRERSTSDRSAVLGRHHYHLLGTRDGIAGSDT